MASRDLVFEVLRDARLVVSCQTRFNPSDTEWDHWLTATSNLEHQVESLRLLVVTEGGHPTKAQLERLRKMNKSNPLTAIISSSLAMRFMASALTFVNPTIRCFSPAHLEDAFEHLELFPGERDVARAALQRLGRELGSRAAPSATV